MLGSELATSCWNTLDRLAPLLPIRVWQMDSWSTCLDQNWDQLGSAGSTFNNYVLAQGFLVFVLGPELGPELGSELGNILELPLGIKLGDTLGPALKLAFGCVLGPELGPAEK